MALSCPRDVQLRVFIHCGAFGTTRPALLGTLAVHLQCQRFMCEQPPSCPHPPHGLWMLQQEKELPLTHRSIFMFFRQSVNCISPGIWGRVPRCSSQRLQAPCLTPRSLRGRREAGKGPPTSSRSPRLRGDLIARFPEFLIHFGLNSFCEAVVWDLTTFQKTN